MIFFIELLLFCFELLNVIMIMEGVVEVGNDSEYGEEEKLW